MLGEGTCPLFLFQFKWFIFKYLTIFKCGHSLHACNNSLSLNLSPSPPFSLSLRTLVRWSTQRDLIGRVWWRTSLPYISILRPDSDPSLALSRVHVLSAMLHRHLVTLKLKDFCFQSQLCRSTRDVTHYKLLFLFNQAALCSFFI